MILSMRLDRARDRADNVSKLMPPSYPNACDLHSKTGVQNACFDWIFALLEDGFDGRRCTRSERRKSANNRPTFEPDLLCEGTRWDADNEHPVLDQLDPTVLRNNWIDHGRPQLSSAVDETQINSSKTTRERVENVA
jgi:hypothetical protein